jgi:corrinoid protein of di/trimethylamine methyltransferase
MNDDVFTLMAQSIINGEPEEAERLARQSLEAGIDPLESINKGFVIGVSYVGDQFSCGEMFLPDLVLAGDAMKLAVSVLEPEMTRRGTHRAILGKVVLCTVEGDIHDIGKTLVGTMLSASGFEVYDMGVDVPIDRLIEKARQVGADLIGVSALLTTTMAKQKTVVEKLKAAGLHPGIKVMVGGAPVTKEWANQIGADGFSEDAIGAVGVAKELMGKS